MAQLSELDVQNLRQVRQYFEQAAQSAKENKQQLMGFLK